MKEYVKLSEVCNIIMGQSPESNSYNELGNGLPFFQGNADFGELYPVTKMWCTEPKKIVEKNTLLISVRAPIGALNFSTERCCIGRGLAGITAKAPTDLKYIYYGLMNKKEELNRLGTGSTFKAINKKVLENTLIVKEKAERQHNIVEVLDKNILIIAHLQKQLYLLDELVKSRFVEMFGDPVFNPKEWPIYELSKYIQFLTSGSRGWSQYFTDNGEYFITIKNVKNCQVILNDVQYVVPPHNAEAKRTRVQEGDLLISITADLGRTGVVTREIADHGGYINQHLTCVRLDRSAVRPLYVAFYMESEAGKRQFQTKNQSAVKAGLNFHSIKTLQIMVPPIELQDSFIVFVKEIHKSRLLFKCQLLQYHSIEDIIRGRNYG